MVYSTYPFGRSFQHESSGVFEKPKNTFGFAGIGARVSNSFKTPAPIPRFFFFFSFFKTHARFWFFQPFSSKPPKYSGAY
jgi:hypothetical protein